MAIEVALPHLPLPTFATVLDGFGSFVFALSGGLLAAEKRFDLFGVLVLSFVVAVAGGVTRDVLIGATPPAAIEDWHTLAIATLAGHRRGDGHHHQPAGGIRSDRRAL